MGRRRRIIIYLFAVFELPEYSVVVLLGDALWVTAGAFDEGLETAFEELIHFPVIVVIVADAEHALDVIPYRASKS